jgi:hypothetical protein
MPGPAVGKHCSRISRKDIIRNFTIRQQIGLEETIIKEIGHNQLTWYGQVQRMAEGRLPKRPLKWMLEPKRARGRPKESWMEGRSGVQVSDCVEECFETDLHT